MPYQVIWSKKALDELADLYLAAPDPAHVTRAQLRIDIALAQNPKSAGQPVAEGLWKIYDAPLLAFFEMNDAHGILRVTDVYYK